MKALTYQKYGPVDQLQLREQPLPEPNDDQLLVKIVAAATNPLDWHTYRADPFLARAGSGWLRPKDGRLGADLTMHKTLAIPEDEKAAAYGEAERCLYINDRALEAADLPPEPKVLDAGCGFGATVFRWQGRIGGTYDGLTLSRVQQRLARREARRRGLEEHCRFHLRSYDDHIDDFFDVVVSIEALIHSPDFERTFAHLVGCLKENGTMVIVEDIPLDAAKAGRELAG